MQSKAIFWPRCLLLLMFFGALAVRTEATQAATIERYVSPLMGCDVRISGVLEPGDAARIETTLRALEPSDFQAANEARRMPNGRRVCLNSPGGSLEEALLLANVLIDLSRATAVDDGDSCESACAILFMMGTWIHPDTHGSIWHNRVLHPRARLGFHAPSLVLPTGSFSDAEVRSAYNLALETLALISEFRELSVGYFPESLFLQMLRTPPEDIYLIETVSQAVQWEIGVLGVQHLQDPMWAVLNLCINAQASILGSYSYGGQPTAAFMEFAGVSASSPTRGATREGFFGEATERCTVTPTIAPLAPEETARVEFGNGWRVTTTYPFQSHHMDTPLRLLPLVAR